MIVFRHCQLREIPLIDPQEDLGFHSDVKDISLHLHLHE